MKNVPLDRERIAYIPGTDSEVSMVVASGYLEVNGNHNVVKIVDELKRRGIGINDTAEERIIFIMERENIDVIKSEIALLKEIGDVRSVHLTYYSVENH